MEKNPTIIPVVAAALQREDGKILLQKRRLGGQFGGLWEFPGGKCEAGEKPDAALARELCEELGLAVAREALLPVSFAHNDVQPHLILLYLCRAWQGEPRCLDGEALGWFAPEEIGELEMPPLDYPLAESLMIFI